jgi:phosphopantetheinyl transferase
VTRLARKICRRYDDLAVTGFLLLEIVLSIVAPEVDEVQVLLQGLDVCSEQYSACEQVLNAEELSRANRFVHEDVRRRFVVCRGSLRHWLAAITGEPPADIQFEYERWGKPRLAALRSSARRHPAWHFNVSHSGEWAVLAVAQSPIGVDLEIMHERLGYSAIASQILTASEQQAWRQLAGRDRELAVWQLWVCKEALLKAMGLGIAEGLMKVSFPLPIPTLKLFTPCSIEPDLQLHLDDDGSCRTNHWIDSASWRLQMLDVLPNSCAAICTPRAIRKITMLSS